MQKLLGTPRLPTVPHSMGQIRKDFAGFVALFTFKKSKLADEIPQFPHRKNFEMLVYAKCAMQRIQDNPFGSVTILTHREISQETKVKICLKNV